MNNPRALTSAISVLIGLFAVSTATAQTTWYVDQACSPPGDGSQGDAFCTIAEGIAAAANGDAVLVRPGTYVGEGNRDLSFGGKLITVRGETGAENCIIDCGGSESSPHRAFIFDSGETNAARLFGLTMRNGYALDDGGAVWITGSNPTIESCVFTDNYVQSEGGAIYITGSSPIIENCTFTDNFAGSWGGAISCGAAGSSAIISNCRFMRNQAAEGGAIITTNFTTTSGMPMVLIDRCFIAENISLATGGGITAEGNVVISNSDIVQNSAGIFGGGVFGNDGNRTIINCRITGNYAGTTGGGLAFLDAKVASQVTIQNSVVSGNQASSGGIGGFFREVNDGVGPLVIQNSIFWDNLPDQLGGEIYQDGVSQVTITFNDINGGESRVSAPVGYTYLNNQFADPLFIDADGEDNDPTTYFDNNYRLQSGSTLIDAATNAAIETVGADLDGLKRFVDDLQTADSGVLSPAQDCAVADIGPYEFQPPPAAVQAEPSGVLRNRFLSFTNPNTGPTAIRIKLTGLQHPNPPNVPQNPPSDFSAYESATCTATGEANDCARWVGKQWTFLESQENSGGPSFRAARLQCTPFYQDWSTESVIHVTGAEIVPSSTYDVQIVRQPCDGILDAASVYSTSLTVETARYGDIVTPFQALVPPELTQPDATDVTQLVNKFRNVGGAPVKVFSQLQPDLPDLNADISASDIVACMDAFKSFAYPYIGPCPCPSEVPCATTPCYNNNWPACAVYGVNARCVKTCVGGTNDGQPCDGYYAHHCPGGTCGPATGVCIGGSNPGDPCPVPPAASTCLNGGTCGLGFCRDRCGRCNP